VRRDEPPRAARRTDARADRHPVGVARRGAPGRIRRRRAAGRRRRGPRSRRHLLARRPAQRATAARRPPRHRARAGQLPGVDRRRPRARARRVGHEGRPGGDGRARAGGRAVPLPVLRARGAPGRGLRAHPTACARAARRRARGDDGADRVRAARRLPRQRQRDLDVPRALRPLGPPVDRRERDRACRRGRARTRRPATRAARLRRAGVRRGRQRHADRRRDRRERDPRPGRVPRELPLRAGAQRRRGGGAAGAAVRRARRADDRLQRAAAGDLVRAPKQAWTPVAEFGLAGLPAVNFGPGDPAQAHRRDESVEIAALARAYQVLERFVA